MEEKNILKIRDDEKIELSCADQKFTITNNKKFTWLGEDSENISLSVLRQGIEPWLTSLFQSEHLSCLVGNGLSIAVQSIAKNSGAQEETHSSNANNAENTTNLTMAEQSIKSEFNKLISQAAEKSSQKSNRCKPNIEDQIRVMNELIRGLEILGYDLDSDKKDESHNKDKYEELCDDLEKLIKSFVDKISDMEKSIVITDKRDMAFGYLVNFLMSFASRTGTRERLNIFTTNYDRLIEAAAELAGLHLLDRFVGTLSPIFRSSRLDIDMHYNPPGIRGEPRYLEGVARFTKLHGSIDWLDTGSEIRKIGLPLGSSDLSNFLNAPGLNKLDHSQVIIYPNSSKDKETSEYPYVELFRDFAAALCRPNSTLVTYGYGFGDDHINRVIKDMLTIPSTHLVIISYDDIDGRITQKINEFGRESQISLIIGKDIADLSILVDYFMPKPSIDKASIRMGELIKQRYAEPQTIITKKTFDRVDKSEGGAQ